MNIYHLRRIGPIGWDETSDMIVVADDETSARSLAMSDRSHYGTEGPEPWAKAQCEEIGTAAVGTPRIVLSSFLSG